jgi:hypothetical protein
VKQALTPTQPHAEPPLLLTKAQLKKWLQVSDMWVRMQLDDPEFKKRCVADISTPGSSRQTLRFPAAAVAAYLGIPADGIATLAA